RAPAAETAPDGSGRPPLATQQTGAPSTTTRSTPARAGAMRAATPGATVTPAPWRATATTSATESGDPSTAMTGRSVGLPGGITPRPPPSFPYRSAGLLLAGLGQRDLTGGVDVDRHRGAVLAGVGVAPRPQESGPRRVERH